MATRNASEHRVSFPDESIDDLVHDKTTDQALETVKYNTADWQSQVIEFLHQAEVPDDREMAAMTRMDRYNVHDAILERLERVDGADDHFQLALAAANRFGGDKSSPVWLETYAHAAASDNAGAETLDFCYETASRDGNFDWNQWINLDCDPDAKAAVSEGIAHTLFYDARKLAAGDPAATAVVEAATDAMAVHFTNFPDYSP